MGGAPYGSHAAHWSRWSRSTPSTPAVPYLFPHPGTLRPYSPNMVRLLHNRVIEEAGLDHVRFADLRHTFAVRSLQSGTSLKNLTEILGYDRAHRTKSNYQGYVHGKAAEKPVCAACTPPNEALKQAAEKLGAMLKV